MQGIQVTILRSPTDAQVAEMVDMTVTALEKDITIKAMTGGVYESRVALFRLAVRAAALEGALFVCQRQGSEKILSLGICFGPGVDYLGSEAQRALGAEEFFKNLPDETKTWYNEVNRPMIKRFIDDTIGQEKLTKSWFLSVMVTLENERQKGYGSAVVSEICKQTVKDKTISVLNTTTDGNVAFYQKLGYRIVGSAERPSPFGTWNNNLMVYDPQV